MAEDLTGGLLLASPTLLDPNFARTAVVVCAHDDDGSLGLVLNRPTEIPVGDHLPGWVERLARPEVVFVGGPVQPETAVGLALRLADPPDGWTEIRGRLGLLDLSTPPGASAGHLEALRVFSGYAGWSPGQLEAEVAAGDWFPVPLQESDTFSESAASLWPDALRRQGGRLAWYAAYPPHPALN
jgi:putative transcriptional regulator